MDTDDAGPFDPSRLVVSPVAGRSYRMFVRIWNLGLFPASGVLVRGWAVDPGFIGSGDPASAYFRDHEVGAAWSDLTDRRQPGCTTVVELDQPWKVEADDVGHRCVIAQVSCPMDQPDGPLLVNADRHVAQRNLTVLSGPMPVKALLAHLGGLVPERFTLEVTHAGPQALGVLQAIGGGMLPGPDGEPVELRVPELGEVPVGLIAGRSVHLLTAFTQDGRTVVARSDHLAELAGVKDPGRQLHPFERAGGTRRLLEQLGEETWKRAGWLSDSALDEALVTGFTHLLDVDTLDAGAVARRLGGEGLQHALRFTLNDPEGQLVGGYTVVVS